MDLDALAGVIAYKHTVDSVTTVTAAVDRITINHPLNELCDLELSGMVTFATGRSSMEISIQVAKLQGKGAEIQKEDIVMTCAFTMVIFALWVRYLYIHRTDIVIGIFRSYHQKVWRTYICYISKLRIAIDLSL